MGDFVTKAEFARMRGVTEAAVSMWIKRGLLVVTDDGLVDVKASEAILDSRAVTAQMFPKDDRAAYLAARTQEAEAKARKAWMEAERMAARLVSREEVEKAAFSAARRAQEILLTVPNRLASILAGESDPAKIHDLLEREMRQVAQELAAVELPGIEVRAAR